MPYGSALVEFVRFNIFYLTDENDDDVKPSNQSRDLPENLLIVRQEPSSQSRDLPENVSQELESGWGPDLSGHLEVRS